MVRWVNENYRTAGKFIGRDPSVRCQFPWLVLSTMSRTFTMKRWWSGFNDVDVWCQYCLQCEGHSSWNVGGQTSVILTCVDVSIVCNVMDNHHEMLVVRLQWFWRVLMSVLSAMLWTFTMKWWWSHFSDFYRVILLVVLYLFFQIQINCFF